MGSMMPRTLSTTVRAEKPIHTARAHHDVAHDALGHKHEPIGGDLADGHRHHGVAHGATVHRTDTAPVDERHHDKGADQVAKPHDRPVAHQAAKLDLLRGQARHHEHVAGEQLGSAAQHEHQAQAEADAADHALSGERHRRDRTIRRECEQRGRGVSSVLKSW